MKERKNVVHPKRIDEHKVNELVLFENGKEVKNKKEGCILETIPKHILEKLDPREKEFLINIFGGKIKEQKLKDNKPDLIEHPKPRHPELPHLEDMQEIELMIQLCGNKHELIKLLTDINRILLENSKAHYHVNVKKRK